MGGGQDQWDRRSTSIQPEAKTTRAGRGQGQELGARIHRTSDRANSETNINQKTKKTTKPRQIPKPHTVLLGQHIVFLWFFGVLVSERLLLQRRRSGPMGPEVKVNTA